MKVLAVVTARGGSKRIPGKNIKLLGGKPLISYSILAGQEASLIDKLIVSTDSQEIADIARKWGGEVPFLRPNDLALDETGDKAVLKHALNFFRDKGQSYDLLVHLRPTSPFKTGQLIDDCINKIQANLHFSSLRTVDKASGTNHPYWMFRSDEDACLEAFIPGVDLKIYYQRQLLPECLKINGVVDVLKAEYVLGKNSHLGTRVGYNIIDPSMAHDIDTIEEFEYCEFLMEKKINLDGGK